MKFDGTFEIEDADTETVWTALSDPIMVQNALPGCQCLVHVNDPDDVDFDNLQSKSVEKESDALDPEAIAERAFQEGETYAAVMSISIGSVKPRFDTLVTIEDRDFPKMTASGTGDAGNSSFEMDSGMTLSETETGVAVEWWATVDIVGRIASLGQRLINPAANRIVKRFFSKIEEELRSASESQVETESEKGLVGSVRNRLGISDSEDST